MVYSAATANRTVGQYPLSIATSLAIESLTGIHPEIQVIRAPILDVPHVWINIKTLFRNLMGSLSKDDARLVLAPELAAAIIDEMGTIVNVLHEATSFRSKVVFYVSNYAGMESKYRYAVLRKDNTELQKQYTTILKQAIQLVIDQAALTNPIVVYDLKLTPKPQEPKTIILTHYAYDLLSAKSFVELILLESHTGKLKPKSQWYTKYANGKDLSMIPFREDFLQIFGDSETFAPFPIKSRRAIVELAEKYRWTSLTSTDKIRYGVDSLLDPLLRETIKEIMVS